jgi:pimeloyl-ACP methyl ester carboxylesterase
MKRALFLLAIAACASAPPPPAKAPEPQPKAVEPPSFQPTSFSVRVAGTGRPVIFIPGLGCPSSVWDETVAHLGAGVQAHVLQVAGFAGAPAMSGDAPLSRTVREELAHYIADRHLQHPVIVGHSMGGFIAMWLAAESPELVGPVVEIDGIPHISGIDEASAGKMRDHMLAMNDAEFAQANRDFFANMFADPKRADVVIKEVIKSDKRAFANAFHELVVTDIRSELPKITAPVLVLVADGPVADEILKQTAAIPHHDGKLVPHTHHFVMDDDPKSTFAAIDAFLAAHP